MSKFRFSARDRRFYFLFSKELCIVILIYLHKLLILFQNTGLLSMPSISLRTTNFCLVLCVLILSFVNADPTNYNQVRLWREDSEFYSINYWGSTEHFEWHLFYKVYEVKFIMMKWESKFLEKLVTSLMNDDGSF